MTQLKTDAASNDRLGRPDQYTGPLLAGIHAVDVEQAVFKYLGEDEWKRWRQNHPDQLDKMVERIGEQLAENILIDARLEEYVSENLKHTSASV